MSFAAYNGVQQSTNNSCGAFALAAALVHLNRATVPALLDAANLKSNGWGQLAPKNLALAIYQTTGCLNINTGIVPRTATYQYANPVVNMNPPSALLYMAAKHGVKEANISYNAAAQAFFTATGVTNASAGGLNLLEMETDIIHTPFYANITAPVNYNRLPVANEVHLILVNNYSHWVVISNNELYNPGNGFVGAYTINNPFTNINYNNGAPQTLQFSGMWISLMQP